MKISLNWLSDYIEIEQSVEQIAEILSDSGLPCEGIEQLGDDTVIDVEVTSNRGDCLGYIGIARELAAATGKELKIPKVKLNESDKDVAKSFRVVLNEIDIAAEERDVATVETDGRRVCSSAAKQNTGHCSELRETLNL